jgi:D-aminopeptidase
VTVTHTSDGRPRARGLGIDLPGEPGPFNAITGVVSWVNRVNPRPARQWLLPVCAETGTATSTTSMAAGARHELTVAGRNVGRHLTEDNPLAGDWFEIDLGLEPPPGTGSVITVVATDAPLLPGQCKALARRVPLGLARTGTTGSHFSGDIFLAFSTANVPGLASAFPVGPVGSAGQDEFGTLTFVPWGRMDDFSTAVVQSVEEAVLNALIVNGEMIGRDGHRSPGLPLERLTALLS